MTSGKQRFSQFYGVGKAGGLPDKLLIPHGEIASLSPDGKKVAYTPISQAFPNVETLSRRMAGGHLDLRSREEHCGERVQ